MQEGAPTARVIMVTAFASIELAVEAMKLGATDFMRKPMTPDILRNTVAAALAKPPGRIRRAASRIDTSPATAYRDADHEWFSYCACLRRARHIPHAR